jgi:hypothetical protein
MYTGYGYHNGINDGVVIDRGWRIKDRGWGGTDLLLSENTAENIVDDYCDCGRNDHDFRGEVKAPGGWRRLNRREVFLSENAVENLCDNYHSGNVGNGSYKKYHSHKPYPYNKYSHHSYPRPPYSRPPYSHHPYPSHNYPYNPFPGYMS